MTRSRRVGGADRVDPQLLAKFASKIRVSTHVVEASGDGRRASAILPGVDATTMPDPGRERYRRGQRRRALIAWSVLGLIVVGVGLAIALGGGGGKDGGSDGVALTGLLPAEMSASAYSAIHKGQSEVEVLGLIGVPGQGEGEIEESELLPLFPAEPSGTSCRFWRISEAPNHLVRLCFGGTPASLEQKSVAAKGEDAAPQTLA